jgi:hypothetical protein
MEEEKHITASNDKALAQAREKLRSTFSKHDSERAIEILNSYAESMRARLTRSVNDNQRKKDQVEKVHDEVKALKKTINEFEKLKEQYSKLQEDYKLLKEENVGLNRTVKGIKAFSKLSEERKSSILSMPSSIKPESASSPAPAGSKAAQKFRQSGANKAAATAATSKTAAAVPTSLLNFQTSLASGLNSLVASIQSSSSSAADGGRGSSSSSSSVPPKLSKRKRADVAAIEDTAVTTAASTSTSSASATASASAGTSAAAAAPSESESADDAQPKKARPGRLPEVPFPLLRKTLERFKEIYGHLVIAEPFIVPCNDSWPDEMWGIKLGKLAVRIRSRGGYKEHHVEMVRVYILYIAY